MTENNPGAVRRGPAPLLPHQLEVVSDRTSKIRVVQGGYRSGKTVTGLACVVDMGLRSEGAPILVVEPTYRLILDVFIRCAAQFLTLWKIPWRYHKSDKILTIGRRFTFDVLCRSADQPRALEGLTVGGLLVDEWELCDLEALQVAFARVSVGPCCQKVLTGTPEGYGLAYDWLLGRPAEKLREDGIRVWTINTAQNTELPRDYASDMRKRMDDDVAGEKLDGVRRAKGGRVYSRFDRSRHTRDPAVAPGTGEVQIFADFNVNPMVWLIAEADTKKKALHVVGEFVGRNTDTAAQAEKIKPVIADYLKRTRRRHYSIDDVTEMGIKVFCDASGIQRTATTHVTNVALLKQAGFHAKHGMKNPPVDDRINTVQVMLRDRRLTVDPGGAPSLVTSLERQAWVKEQPDKTGGIDHPVDSLGYGCFWQFPVWRSGDREARD
jgi:hypothetical protein